MTTTAGSHFNGRLPETQIEIDEKGAGWKPLYSCYVLAVLLAANILNFADRSILSVLAQPIKDDLHISDAQLGFLYGTSFVMLNAVFGIVMGRVADLWLRNRLMAIGIGLWSIMTAFSGLASSYGQLAASRVGIGVGEASISPSGHSFLADIFPARHRSLVFGIFLCGSLLGYMVALTAGGWIVQNWPGACRSLGLCGVRGWQAAFLAFGLPGLVVALLILFIREPDLRGDRARRAAGRPLVEAFREFSFILPPFALIRIARLGGSAMAWRNGAIAAILVALAGSLIRLTGDWAQWASGAAAAYALLSWCQSQAFRDPSFYRLTIGSPAFRFLVFGIGIIGTLGNAIWFWSVPLAIRRLGLSPAEAGAAIGSALGVGSLIGHLAGGILADRWRKATPAAPLYIGVGALIGSGMVFALLLLTTNKMDYALTMGLFVAVTTTWSAGIAALIQDMILPPMRARAQALYGITVTLIGMTTGPYVAGRIADLTGSLPTGLAALYLAAPVGFFFLLMAVRTLPAALTLRRDMALAAH
jgi:MFS family permease